MGRFSRRLSAFLLPLLALYSVPVATMVPSGEVLSADTLAQKHAQASADALYGPAYTNPDKRYKLVSTLLHDAPVVALGTSRVMTFRSTFFAGGESTFYNAGGLVSRLSHMRRALAHLPRTGKTRELLVGFDQWSYNDNWEGVSDDPGVEAEYLDSSDPLGNLRYGLQAWPDFMKGKLPVVKLLGHSESYGVNATLRGNGFRRDGSYLYTDILRDPASAADYQFKDSLARLRDRRSRFEGGGDVSLRALEETRAFLAECRERGIAVVGFLPPFAPTVAARLRESPDHRYLQALPGRLHQVFDAAGVPLFDFTSCAQDDQNERPCTDAEFVDGFHGGDMVYARILLEMAKTVPWVRARLAPGLGEWVGRAAGRPTL